MDGKQAHGWVISLHDILATLNFFVRFPLLFYKLSPYCNEVFLTPEAPIEQLLIYAVKLKIFHCIEFDFARHLIYNHWSDQFSR